MSNKDRVLRKDNGEFNGMRPMPASPATPDSLKVSASTTTGTVSMLDALAEKQHEYDAMMAALKASPLAAVPVRDTDPGTSGRHPVYGGHNWGIKYSEHWNDWSVNHGFYGSSDTNDRNEVFIDSSPIPLADDEVRWACDAPDKITATIVWQYRDAITKGLYERGFTPQRGVRVGVSIHNNELHVRPYDWPNDFTGFRIPIVQQA